MKRSTASRNRAFLALGSNLEAEVHLEAAVRALESYGRVVAVSDVWQTTPVGLTDQPDFLNAALILETSLSARELRLEAIAAIERRLGRRRDPDNPNAARRIDIDIALFNDDILQFGHRQIPDPEILERPFLAIPLAQLDPDYRHPIFGKTLAEIAASFKPKEEEMRRRQDVRLSAGTG